MKPDFERLFRKLNKKHSESRIDLWDKRQQWGYVVRTATKVFEEVIVAGKESNYWESLFIQSSNTKPTWEGKKYTNFSFIALCLGQHATDISFVEYKEGKRIKPGIISEIGAAFLISQLPNGGVTFNIYPCSSEMHNSDRESKLIKVFERPYDIDEAHIRQAVRKMLHHANDTSYTQFYPFGKYCVELLHKHRKDITIMLTGAFIGAILSLALTYKSENNKKAPEAKTNNQLSKPNPHEAASKK